MQITIFGSGYVGLVTGACMAEVGNHVVGVDIDELGLVLHVDSIEAELHQRPVPHVCVLVHGAARAGIVA